MYRSTAEGAFVSVNPALARMLGYESEEELIGADLAHDIYVEQAAREVLVERYADAERVEGLEIEWRRKDGTPILVRLGGRPVRTPDGPINHSEMIVEDITERRALEDQLRQAQKMEAVGQLTGGIAHDFNNLLTVILANSDILEAGLPGDHPELRADIEELRRAARRGADMVRKLLGYSRRGVLALGPVDLCAFVAELLPTLRRLLPENIEIRFEPSTQHGNVVADEGAIEQILFNLATNARDAMRGGGTVVLGIDRANAGTRSALEEWGAAGEYVRVTVRDSGSGMDEITRERIFDPFFTTKRVGQGTGLGMAMVYGLVKQQGGFIDVESTLGGGTVVHLYFPPTAAPRESATEASVVELPVGSETILLVEDEAALRRSGTRALESYGYRVLEARDGEEALEIVERGAPPIDLVVSDVIMPRLGGKELYEQLRAKGNLVPFLFTSGYQQQVAHDEGVLDPAIPFLPKPWELRDLLAHVRQALDEEPS
jgi:PAS domain S-box-containing protein